MIVSHCEKLQTRTDAFVRTYVGKLRILSSEMKSKIDDSVRAQEKLLKERLGAVIRDLSWFAH
jgi:hypothetical protein